MTEPSATPTHRVTDLTYHRTVVTDTVHLTGGLRAMKTVAGWKNFPFLGKEASNSEPISDEALLGFCNSAGVTLIGEDECNLSDPDLPVRTWTPFFGPPRLALPPSDTWRGVTINARMAGDDTFANLSRNLALSLQAAGIRLRDASDEYHKQLMAALKRGKRVGGRFKNSPMLDLHLAFHSALTEMAGARDYLAQFACRRVNAPAKIDALGRLQEWVSKPINASAKSDALVLRLLEASDCGSSDPWLADITNFRNQFLHREHMGASEPSNWLMVEERESALGKVRTITMAVHVRPGDQAICDALARFVGLYANLCRLADFAGTLAPYPAKPLHLTL
jgi:hypothetical protein